MTKTQSPASDLELALEPALAILLEKVHNRIYTWTTVIMFATLNATDEQIRYLFLTAIAEKDDCNGAWVQLLAIAVAKRALWLEDYNYLLGDCDINSLPKETQWTMQHALWEAAQYSGAETIGRYLIKKLFPQQKYPAFFYQSEFGKSAGELVVSHN